MMYVISKEIRRAAAFTIIKAQLDVMTSQPKQVWISEDGEITVKKAIPDSPAFKSLIPKDKICLWNATRKNIREIQAMQAHAPKDARFEHEDFSNWVEWYLQANFLDKIRWI